MLSLIFDCLHFTKLGYSMKLCFLHANLKFYFLNASDVGIFYILGTPMEKIYQDVC